MSKPVVFSVLDDVSACCGALAFNELSAIARLPASKAYERLKQIIENSILAYCEAVEGFGLPPEPSQN